MGVSSETIFGTGKAPIFGQTVTNMRENGSKIRSMVKGCFNMRMETHTKVSISMIKWMGKVLLSTEMETDMREDLKMGKGMERESECGRMAITIKGNGYRIREMALASSNGITKTKNIKDNSKVI